MPIAMESRQKDIMSRREAGETLESIGQSYGISRERVRQILDKAGYNGRLPYPLTHEVAEMAHVGKSTAWVWAEKEGLKRFGNRIVWTSDAVKKFLNWRRAGISDKPCDICGKPIPFTRRNHCSKECYAKACAISHSKYLWQRMKDRVKPNVAVICPSCGKVRMRFPSQITRGSHCAECARRIRREAHTVTVACDWCGKQLVYPKARAEKQKHYFCNSREMALWRHRHGGFRKAQ